MRMRSNGTANLASSSSKLYSNKVISVSDWVADTSYAQYPYKANLTCTGITSNDFVEVDMGEVPSILAPFVMTSDNTVSFYASEIPSEDIIINSILSSSTNYAEYGFVITAADDSVDGYTVTATKI